MQKLLTRKTEEMKNDFDKKLADKLNSSSLEDLGLSPNRENMWRSIEQKQQKKTINFRMWLTHAAAIALGVFAGIYFLGRDKDATVKYVVVEKPAKQAPAHEQKIEPTEETNIDNTISQAEPRKAKSATTYIAATPKQSETVIAPKQPIPEIQPSTLVIEEKQPPVYTTLEPTTVAATSTKPKKVLHLADMTNENNNLVERKRYKTETFWAGFVPRQPFVKDNYETFSNIVADRIR
jgi:hypothetical protein